MDYLVVIDDEPELSRFVGRVGESVGYKVHATSEAQDFKDLIGRVKPHVIILDLAMPKTDGLELLCWLAAENCQAHIIIMSGVDGRVVEAAKEIGRARGLGIAFTFTKPIRVQDLKEKLESLHTIETHKITEAELNRCLEEREFCLFYQPKIALKRGGLQGVEAVLKWRNPSHWTIAIDQYVKLIEEAGLSEKLTKFVMTEAVYQQKFWSQQRLNIPIAINLSTLDLRNPALADDLASICENENVAPDRIVLEVAESAIMSHALETLDVLTRLRLKGFRLSIDGFGSGFSSLKRLRRLPVKEVKIDPALTMEAPVSNDAVVVIKTLIDIAHNMGLTTVAEGIETIEHYQLLEELGCDLAQGPGIAEAISASEFVKWNDWWKSSASAEHPPKIGV